MQAATQPIYRKLKANLPTRLFAGVGVAALAGFCVFVAANNPSDFNVIPPCPFRALTGLNCPGCGLTRGFHALFHGDILTALHFNLLLPAYAFILGVIALSIFLTAVRGRGLSLKILSPNFLIGFLIVSLLFGVLRNLPFYPFNLLAI